MEKKNRTMEQPLALKALEEGTCFVTYFNRFYLRKALLMYLSLRRWMPRSKYRFYCYDERSFSVISSLGLPNLTPIKIEAVESWSGISHDLFPDRSAAEYMFTMTPLVIRHTRQSLPLMRIVYVDSDYYFYSSPASILEKAKNCDASFVQHGFPPEYAYLAVHGTYNVGWNYFSTSMKATRFINHWCLRTIEWCYDKIEGDKYADQKYLDEVSGRIDLFCAVEPRQIGLAEYNFFQHNIEIRKRSDGGVQIMSGGIPVVAWHHHGVIEQAKGKTSVRINIKEARESAVYHKIYASYINKLGNLANKLEGLGLCPGYGNTRRG
jgi:hypothetical protein